MFYGEVYVAYRAVGTACLHGLETAVENNLFRRMAQEKRAETRTLNDPRE